MTPPCSIIGKIGPKIGKHRLDFYALKWYNAIVRVKDMLSVYRRWEVIL